MLWNYKLDLDLKTVNNRIVSFIERIIHRSPKDRFKKLCMMILVIQIGKSHLLMDIHRQVLSWWKCSAWVEYYVVYNRRDKLNLTFISNSLVYLSINRIFVSVRGHFKILLVERDNKVKSTAQHGKVHFYLNLILMFAILILQNFQM